MVLLFVGNLCVVVSGVIFVHSLAVSSDKRPLLLEIAQLGVELGIVMGRRAFLHVWVGNDDWDEKGRLKHPMQLKTAGFRCGGGRGPWEHENEVVLVEIRLFSALLGVFLSFSSETWIPRGKKYWKRIPRDSN